MLHGLQRATEVNVLQVLVLSDEVAQFEERVRPIKRIEGNIERLDIEVMPGGLHQPGHALRADFVPADVDCMQIWLLFCDQFAEEVHAPAFKAADLADRELLQPRLGHDIMENGSY